MLRVQVETANNLFRHRFQSDDGVWLPWSDMMHEDLSHDLIVQEAAFNNPSMLHQVEFVGSGWTATNVLYTFNRYGLVSAEVKKHGNHKENHL